MAVFLYNSDPSGRIFISESEDGGEWEEGLRLSSLLSLRSDLSRGDLRSIKLVHQFNKMWESRHSSKMGKKNKQRTVAELLKEAEYATQHRKRMQAEKIAAEQAEQQRVNKIAREKRLNEITGREPTLWNQIESLASEKKALSYDKAIELLIDLRDLANRGDRSEFLLKLDALKQRHSAKSSFISRLSNFEL